MRPAVLADENWECWQKSLLVWGGRELIHTTPSYSLPVSQVEGLDVLTQGWASLSLHPCPHFPLSISPPYLELGSNTCC